MRALVAMDSFKGNLTSLEAGEAVAKGLQSEGWRCRVLPMADGGEGTGEVLARALGGSWEYRGVTGPLGGSLLAPWLKLPGRCAFIEVASASGLPLVLPSRRDPMKASTCGTGQLVRAAAAQGAREVMIGLGGSATVDGGWGMLAELGLKAFDEQDMPLKPNGANLCRIARLDGQELMNFTAQVKLLAMADVTNPLLGPQGAAAVFGPQKGASVADVRLLEEGLRHFNDLLARLTGRNSANWPGAGAAGGLGGALASLTGRPPARGFDVVARALKLDEQIAGVDFVFTGEGRVDGQSSWGKVVGSMACRCKAKGKPLVALTGGLKGNLSDLWDAGLTAAFCIGDGPVRFHTALEHSRDDLIRTAKQVARLIRAFIVPSRSLDRE